MYSPAIDEGQLIAGLKEGRKSAFDAIYRLYGGRLMAFCRQWVKSREDAEEIVEDTFVRLWRSREQIRQDQTLATLLFVTTRRLTINAFRHRALSPEYADYVECMDSASVDDALHHIEYDDFTRRLRSTLAELPKTQAEVVRLTRFEGLSNREAAAALGLSEQTVKNQVSLALKTLRPKLRGSWLWLLMCMTVN